MKERNITEVEKKAMGYDTFYGNVLSRKKIELDGPKSQPNNPSLAHGSGSKKFNSKTPQKDYPHLLDTQMEQNENIQRATLCGMCGNMCSIF